MNSAIFVGTIRHRRHIDPVREFTYPVHYGYLDLAELPHALDDSKLWSASPDRRAPFTFRRRDHLRPVDQPLGRVVRDLVQEQLGVRPLGAIRTLTQPAFLGVAFNPITLHFCFDAGDGLCAVVAEVTNTPWLERTAYVLPADSTHGVRTDSPKQLHVSPFLPMRLDHRWRIGVPGDRLVVHLSDHPAHDPDARPAFDATLRLERRELTPAAIRRLTRQQGPMLTTVVGGIYTQAARLLLRGARFHPHPNRQRTHPSASALDNELFTVAS